MWDNFHTALMDTLEVFQPDQSVVAGEWKGQNACREMVIVFLARKSRVACDWGEKNEERKKSNIQMNVTDL